MCGYQRCFIKILHITHQIVFKCYRCYYKRTVQGDTIGLSQLYLKYINDIIAFLLLKLFNAVYQLYFYVFFTFVKNNNKVLPC